MRVTKRETNMKNIQLICFAIAMLATTQPAFAGRSCEEKSQTPETVSSALGLALKVKDYLDSSGAQVAIIGRVGRDMSAHGLRYSHSGIVTRDAENGHWLVLHELNQCGSNRSDLFDQGLGNFFLDDMFAYDALIAIPSTEVQQRLWQAARSSAPRDFHQSHYSLIASPFSTKYQNSNQWVLEMLTPSLAPDKSIKNRAAAQEWLKQTNYVPSKIKISQTKRLGAKLFASNVYFDDHSGEEWIAQRYEAVTVESMLAFLATQDKQLQQKVVQLK
jgi:hypothetical protein